jgi:ketosteroid isomerase-like protein/catechol 2,3-dioxygenase-like lactoylglutathione lyase family enzyme
MNQYDRPSFTGGRNIALKTPPHLFDRTVAFYRDILGLSLIEQQSHSIVFAFGTNRLWIDKVEQLSQAELWLEVITDDLEAAERYLDQRQMTRRDEIEPLPDGFAGFWIATPADIITLVRAPERAGEMSEAIIRTNISSHIQDLERQLRDATLRNDVAQHDQLLADTWMNTNANGSVTTKAQLLQLLREQPFTFVSIEEEDVAIQVYAGCAVVTGRSLRRRLGRDGREVTLTVRFTRVYASRDDRWQVISAHATPIVEPGRIGSLH